MVAPAPEKRSLFKRTKAFDATKADNLFYWATFAFAALVLVLVVWIAFQLIRSSSESIERFGLGFLTSSVWKTEDAAINPNNYGAWPYIYGTLMSSFLALFIAVPIGLGTAIYLSELAPRWVRTPLSFMVELLAAVPSVVYGLWGVLVMIPAILPFQNWLYESFNGNALLGRFFNSPPSGQSMMSAALVLAIMILPFISAVSREVIKAVPPSQREAAFGLGSTHWEAISGPILRTARSGIIGAIILGLARALGETMAVTMVIGNSANTDFSLLSPASTLASKIAMEFGEASGGQQSALMYLALVLFGVTILVNAFARLMIWNMTRSVQGATRL